MGSAVYGPYTNRIYLALQRAKCRCREGLALRIQRTVGVALGLLMLSSCSSLSSTAPVSVTQNLPFALLSFENFSSTPQAQERLRTLVETRLRRNGVDDVHVYAPSQPATLRALFDASSNQDEAAKWAVRRGARYGLSGTVHEWRYRSGVDSEPTVGITLSLTDLKDGSVLWQGNAARSGFGYASLSSVADKTISDLMQKIRFVELSSDSTER